MCEGREIQFPGFQVLPQTLCQFGMEQVVPGSSRLAVRRYLSSADVRRRVRRCCRFVVVVDFAL